MTNDVTGKSQLAAGEDLVSATVEEALDDLRAGRCVVVADSREPESQGDLLVAAQQCTPEVINLMATHGSGIVFLCLPGERVEELGLGPMAPHGDNLSWKQAMTVSIEARHGVTTGISAYDRARTIQAAIDPASRPQDLVQPGHIFPLKARSNGVLDRAGRTEAHVDLARLAGFIPAGVAVELTTDEGSAATFADLAQFARRHNVRIITVADVVRHRWRTERVLERGERVRLHTAAGESDVFTFTERPSATRHLALVRGNLLEPDDIWLSVHAECLPGHVFSSVACECAIRLGQALRTLGQSERAVLIYVRAAASQVTCSAADNEHLASVTRQILCELEISSGCLRSADAATTSVLNSLLGEDVAPDPRAEALLTALHESVTGPIS